MATKKKILKKKSKSRKHKPSAGVISPFIQEHKLMKLLIKKDHDCLPQCFFSLRYTDYSSSVLLQTFANDNAGIFQSDVVWMLDNAYKTKHYWEKFDFDTNIEIDYKKNINKTGVNNYLNKRILSIEMKIRPRIKKSEGVLCFLKSFLMGNYDHYVILFIDTDDKIYIRDPQTDKTLKLEDYLKHYRRVYDTIELLMEDNSIKHTNYKVTSDIIIELIEYHLD